MYLLILDKTDLFCVLFSAPPELGVNVRGACFFDLPESVTSRRIRDSSLWIYLKPPKHKKEQHPLDKHRKKEVYEIYIYIVQAKSKHHDVYKNPVRYKKTTSSGWFEFKMAHFAHHWAKQPDQNRGVIIQAFDSERNNVVITPENTDDEQYVSVFLLFFFLGKKQWWLRFCFIKKDGCHFISAKRLVVILLRQKHYCHLVCQKKIFVTLLYKILLCLFVKPGCHVYFQNGWLFIFPITNSCHFNS